MTTMYKNIVRLLKNKAKIRQMILVKIPMNVHLKMMTMKDLHS